MGNVRGLQRSLANAQQSLGGLDRISQGLTGGLGTATKLIAGFGAAAVGAGVAGAGALAAVPVALGAIGLASAAAGAGIAAGIGGGVLFAGAKLALMNKEVAQAFTDLKTGVVADLQDMAKPFEPVMKNIATQLRGAFDAIGPALRDVFSQAAPILQGFGDQLKPIAQVLAPALTQAFALAVPTLNAVKNSLVPLAQGFAGFITALAPAKQAFADFTSTTMTGFANMLPALGRFLAAMAPIGVAVMGTIMPVLTRMFDFLAQNVGPLFERTVPILGSFGEAFGSIGQGISGFFGHLMSGMPQLQTFVTTLGSGIGAVLPVLGQLIVALAPIGTQVLNILVPAIQTLAQFIIGTLAPAFSSMLTFVSENGTAFGILGGVIATFIVGIKVAQVAMAAFQGVMLLVSAATSIWTGVMAVVSAATKAWAVVQGVLNAVLLANPIGLVIVAIVAFIAILVVAYRESETFRNIVNGAWAAVQSAASALWGAIRSAFQSIINFIKDTWSGIQSATSSTWSAISSVVSSVSSAVSGFISGAFNAIRSVVTSVWSAIQGATSATWSAISGVVSGVASAISGAVSGAMGAIRGAIQGAWSAAQGATSGAWSAMQGAVSGGVAAVMGFIGGLPGRIQGVFAGAGGWLVGAGRNIVQGLINGLSGAIGGAVSAAANLASRMLSAAKGRLGIRSPSREFKKIGNWTTQGLILGLKKTAGVVAAGTGLAAAVSKGFSAPELALNTAAPRQAELSPATAAAAGGNVYLTVNAPVGSNAYEIGRELDQYLATYSSMGGRRQS